MAGEADSQILPVTPKQLADRAAELRRRGNIGLAYTYNEPMVGWEFVRDTARLVRGAVNPRIPLHITRFFPRWKMTDRDATDIRHLHALVRAARDSLEYVFAGNC